MKVYTLGYAGKSAEQFFAAIRTAGEVKRVIDVRLRNTSQLAGYTKRDDLRYFLRELCGVEYLHLPELAPTADMLDEYKKGGGGWQRYEGRFLDLLARRAIERNLAKPLLDGGCLLCSEALPHHCHRRLIAEYLAKAWRTDLHVTHLH